jgi:hypothetical protein
MAKFWLVPSSIYDEGISLPLAPPSNVMNHLNAHAAFIYNGIDRVDNSIGYEMGNVVTCCVVCNLMKRCHSHSDFISHCRAIIAYQDRDRNLTGDLALRIA